MRDLFGRDSPKEPKHGLGQAFKDVFSYASGKQPSAPAAPAPIAKESSFSSLASDKNNFADLLSGKKSPSDVSGAHADAQQKAAGQQQQDADKEQSEEARKKAIEGLKTIGKAAAVGGVSLLTIPPAMKKFSESMLASQEDLKKYNGQIAMAFARVHHGNVRRDIATGRATAGSTDVLARAVNEMRDETQALRNASTNALNYLAAGMAKTVTLLSKLAIVPDILRAIEGNTTPEVDPKIVQPWQDALRQMSISHRIQETARRQNKQMPPQPKGPGGGGKGGNP
ncbi:MAG TPA: hypothetical protein PK867_16505 [Pirellulales bacterium]|nr:hypothetical protein [Pirellulales bacterium]